MRPDPVPALTAARVGLRESVKPEEPDAEADLQSERASTCLPPTLCAAADDCSGAGALQGAERCTVC